MKVRFSEKISEFISNRNKLLSLYRNKLKRIENVDKKNYIERAFYNDKAYSMEISNEELTCEEDEYFPPRYRYFHSLMSDVSNKVILDCGCGTGYHSVFCAKKNAKVVSIDLSIGMINMARRRVTCNNVEVKFCLMPAEQLGFKPSVFDLVVGCGVLHHLQLDLAGKELYYILKPGGRAVFLEPLISSKPVFFLRSILPIHCYESPGGGGLTLSDISSFSRFFSNVHIERFQFFTRFHRFKLLRNNELFLERMDSFLFRNFPFFLNFASAVVIEVVK